MELSDFDREHVNQALSERVGAAGFAGPKVTLLGFIAHRLDLALERLTDLVHYAHEEQKDPTPHLPDLDEMEDIHDEIRYTARCGDCGLAMIVDYHPSSLNCPACGSDDLEFMRIGGEPGDDQRVFTGHADRRMLIENVKRLIQKGCPLKEYMDAERLAEAIVDGPVADRIEKEQKRHG